MRLTWMAWTWETAAFFLCIAGMLIGMTIWELRSPGGAPRRGILAIRTTRGDRLFISLLSARLCPPRLAGSLRHTALGCNCRGEPACHRHLSLGLARKSAVGLYKQGRTRAKGWPAPSPTAEIITMSISPPSERRFPMARIASWRGHNQRKGQR